MATTPRCVRSLWLDEDGATMVEYVLLLLFVAMLAFTAVTTFGVTLMGLFQRGVNGFQ